MKAHFLELRNIAGMHWKARQNSTHIHSQNTYKHITCTEDINIELASVKLWQHTVCAVTSVVSDSLQP